MILVALESMFLKDTDSVTTADSKMPPSECGLDNTGTIFPPLDHPSGSSVVSNCCLVFQLILTRFYNGVL